MEEHRPTYEELLAENRRLKAQVEALTARVEQLMKLLEEKNRSGKRQAAPFSKGEPKKNPEKPGRKSGDDHGQHVRRNVPDHVDEIHAVPLPDCCPCCQSKRLQSDHTVTQWQTDIPQKVVVRQFDIQCGHCEDCGAKVRGRHDLQTSDAVGAAASQLGPNAHAAIAVLNKEVGLTHGKITRVMKILFGLKIGRATSCRSMLRTAKKCEPAYAQIIEEVRGSPLVKIDETGWKVNGLGHWLHVFVTELAVLYRLDRRRGHEVPAEILGLDYGGTMVHDGLASYGRFVDAIHQQCNFHLLTRCRELLEIAKGGAARFPLQVKSLLLQGMSIRDRFLSKEITDRGLTILRGRLLASFGKLLNASLQHAGNARLQKFLIKHCDEIFWYLECPEAISATNNESESELRPNVIARKLSGGNRSDSGRQAQQIIPSITRTCHKLSLDAFEWIKQSLCNTSPQTLFT